MPEDLNSLQDYRNLVLQYEDANAQINALFQVHQGGTETMTDDELAHYRKLQHRRDELFNEMKVLEQELLDEDAQ
jgi:cell division protein FtsB